jgi:selenide,water dikinase
VGTESDPNLLVGISGSDDAGVYRIGEGCALVQTADIISPLVDDPFTFGRIAAANAISDVYAMGGRPVTALNLLFLPPCLPSSVAVEVLRGGGAAMAEAGVCLAGGHTVEDDELKYGLAVTGLIDPHQIVRNNTPAAGDILLLTKPLGTGIVSTAIKGDFAGAQSIDEAIRWMTLLNRRGAELMTRFGAHAATDVTGFGLLGHACEMAGKGTVSLQLSLAAVPLMNGVRELVSLGMVPAGCYRNRDHFSPLISAPVSVADDLLPLYDPQTSGGLLIALPPSAVGAFQDAAAAEGVLAVPVGEVAPWRGSPVVIV